MMYRRTKLFVIAFCLVVSMFVFGLVAFAQEVSGPESSFSVRVYNDTNGNGRHDDTDQEIEVDVQTAAVFHKACWQVTDEDQLSTIVTQTTPFGLGTNAACNFFLISSHGGLVSQTHYDAFRSSADGANIAPTLWILNKGNYRVNLPLVARAWSGLNR